jgi:hypothetical protein
MAGTISATTAALIAAGVGAAGVGAGLYTGAKQAQGQQKALALQKTGQQQAVQSALSTERQGAIAQNAANMKAPDILSILQRAALASKAGVGSTMLTGPGGVQPSQLNLGKTSLLGS